MRCASRLHRVAHDDEVCVIDDVLARRAQVNDALGRRGDFLERVHVGHHVVPQAASPIRRAVEVDVVELRLHLLEAHRC
jgi:hypothetical protein